VSFDHWAQLKVDLLNVTVDVKQVALTYPRTRCLKHLFQMFRFLLFSREAIKSPLCSAERCKMDDLCHQHQQQPLQPPTSINKFRTSILLCFLARSNAVCCCLSTALTSAPLSSSILTTSTRLCAA